MLAFKILQMFLLPSCFILILLGIGLILFLLRKKSGKVLLSLGIILYYFFSITPISDLIILSLENQFKNLNQNLESVEYMVLLTGGVKTGDLPLSSKLTESSLFRTIKAVEIYSQSPKKIIISGVDPITSISVAAKIGELMKELGIPEKEIILEENSKNTYQSAIEVKKIIGNKPFGLVTSAYHLPRSIYIFRKIGLNPIPVPADFKAEKKYNLFDFFPDPENLRKCDLAFHEYFGILYYKLRY